VTPPSDSMVKETLELVKEIHEELLGDPRRRALRAEADRIKLELEKLNESIQRDQTGSSEIR
jgi:DNA-binding transcriptional regulator GbsR (MarR family)